MKFGKDDRGNAVSIYPLLEASIRLSRGKITSYTILGKVKRVSCSKCFKRKFNRVWLK